MFVVSKEVIIHCAHRLPTMPEGHPCRNLHGHTYRVIITLRTPTLDAGGLTVEFGQLAAIVKQYDHQFLGSGNVVIDGQTVRSMLAEHPATAEVFAMAIGHQVGHMLTSIVGTDSPANSRIELVAVDLWETPTSHVRWEPPTVEEMFPEVDL